MKNNLDYLTRMSGNTGKIHDEKGLFAAADTGGGSGGGSKPRTTNPKNLTSKSKGSKLSKKQKAIVWADANRDAANSNPKGYATADDIHIGYDKEDGYATQLTWKRKAKNIHDGRNQKWNKNKK